MLISNWKSEIENNSLNSPIYKCFINEAESFLQKEKQQVIDAYNQGIEEVEIYKTRELPINKMNILGTLKSDIQSLIKLKLEHKEYLTKLIYISDISDDNKYRNDNMSELIHKRILDLHYQILNLEEKLGL